ncbi:hypothetical protein [Ferruginibacter sp. SUN106]|uniref:hypothetical protein n=1 Tax=Ferruginibacter sp. SUN106 TaxID=2978348 RepID=UPI003D36E9BC
MEKYFITNNIKTFYVTATSFPGGVLKAHQALHALLPTIENRKFFGISFPGKAGNIIYKAAVKENYTGEAEQLNCETFIIGKGTYCSETIKDFMKDVSVVGKIFQQLLQHPDLDINGYCLEIYPNEKDIICLVKLNDND